MTSSASVLTDCLMFKASGWAVHTIMSVFAIVRPPFCIVFLHRKLLFQRNVRFAWALLSQLFTDFWVNFHVITRTWNVSLTRSFLFSWETMHLWHRVNEVASITLTEITGINGTFARTINAAQPRSAAEKYMILQRESNYIKGLLFCKIHLTNIFWQ